MSPADGTACYSGASTPNRAPWGSSVTPERPTLGTPASSTSTFAPWSIALATVVSQSPAASYTSQFSGL